jgi:CheY-like chemotaxis protein
VEICEIRAKEKSIDFIYQPDPQLPESIKADEKRLRQVLINLLGNATKFTETGSVSFAVEVLEYPTSDRVLLKFQVSDTGIGIAAEDLNRLFQVFEQVGDRHKKSEGTGLGLAISQKIVQLMGGKIEVTSQLGIGTQFFFTLEFSVVQDWVQQKSNINQEQIVGYVGDRRKIIIIDDRPENRSVLVGLLEPWGFEIIEAENGLEGLEKMRQENPDLVIVDLEMPVMDGFQFLQTLRQDSHFQDSKVIVSSASVSHADRQMALEAGGNDFLPKPVDMKELIQCLAKHLQLEWIPDKKELSNTEKKAKTKTEIILPSSQDLQDLLFIAQQGDTRGIRNKIERLIAQDNRYQEFAITILDLAKKFKIEEIEEVLQKHLDEEKSNVK